MVQDQGLDVYLAPLDDITRRYQQHAVPRASPNFNDDPNEVYIEAVDGERFAVMVDLMEDFDMKGTHLNFNHKIDQDYSTTQYQSWSELADLTLRNTNSRGRSTFEEVVRREDGDWVDCGFVFSSLSMGNDCSTR